MKNKKISPFVDIIRKARLNNGISQEQMADLIGMGRGAYGHIETGRVKLTTDVMIKAFNVLELKIHLIDGKEILK